MSLQAVIFDLDGTLLNTLEDIADATNRGLAAFGFPTHPTEDYRFFVGDGVGMLVKRVVPETYREDEALAASLAESFAANYAECWARKTHPYDGVSEMLDQLSTASIPMAVLSNKPDRFTQDCVSGLLSDWQFDIVMGHGDLVPRKPDPTGAKRILAHWGISSEEVLYVGDTGTDMKTAVAAGMMPLGVLWGFRPEEELRTAGAKKLVSHPREIPEILDI